MMHVYGEYCKQLCKQLAQQIAGKVPDTILSNTDEHSESIKTMKYAYYRLVLDRVGLGTFNRFEPAFVHSRSSLRYAKRMSNKAKQSQTQQQKTNE